MSKEVHSYCRQCPSFCGLTFKVEDNRIVELRGNPDHVHTTGYKCVKADMSLEHMQGHESRLTTCMRRDAAEELQPIAQDALMDEVAAVVRRSIDEHGPRSVGLYVGTQAYRKTFNLTMAKQFMGAIGSDMTFSTMTIDQSAHWVVEGRMGMFATGRPSIKDCDVIVLAGTNPVVSHSGPYNATPTVHQVPRIKEFQQRGGKLIVVDPRLTETARLADLHLQVRPGFDTELFAGLIRIVLENEWQDHAFCERWITNLDALESAVAPFTPDLVAQRTGIDPAQLQEAARIIGAARKPSIGFATGVSMSPNPNTAGHMVEALNAICGGFVRAGEIYANPGTFAKRSPVEAVIPPTRSWETSGKLSSGHGQLYNEFPTSRLADEILTPGPSQIRVLIVIGANPMMTFGDPDRLRQALGSLDCLVMLEPRLNETAAMAKYIVAPPLQWEVEDINLLVTDWVVTPYMHYADPVVQPPPGTLTEWKFFNGLANRLGYTLRVAPFGIGTKLKIGAGTVLTTDRDWETSDLLDLTLADVGLSVAELREYPNGYLLHHPPVPVRAPDEDDGARLDMCPPDVSAELSEVAAKLWDTSPRKYRLICRRVTELMNSEFKDSERVVRRFAGGAPLYMHPDDMAEDGLEPGMLVRIEGEHGKIPARVRPDKTIRRGVVSMPHNWNGVPDAAPASAHNSWLVSMALEHVAPIDAMPQQSSIPVDVSVHA